METKKYIKYLLEKGDEGHAISANLVFRDLTLFEKEINKEAINFTSEDIIVYKEKYIPDNKSSVNQVFTIIKNCCEFLGDCDNLIKAIQTVELAEFNVSKGSSMFKTGNSFSTQ